MDSWNLDDICINHLIFIYAPESIFPTYICLKTASLSQQIHTWDNFTFSDYNLKTLLQWNWFIFKQGKIKWCWWALFNQMGKQINNKQTKTKQNKSTTVTQTTSSCYNQIHVLWIPSVLEIINTLLLVTGWELSMPEQTGIACSCSPLLSWISISLFWQLILNEPDLKVKPVLTYWILRSFLQFISLTMMLFLCNLSFI